MKTTRLDFLQSAALAVAGATLGMRTEAAEANTLLQRPRPLRFSADMRDGLNPRRVTNAMSDYSWLPQHYPGGAFADFNQASGRAAGGGDRLDGRSDDVV